MTRKEVWTTMEVSEKTVVKANPIQRMGAWLKDNFCVERKEAGRIAIKN